MTTAGKEDILRRIGQRMQGMPEVAKVTVIGSFLDSDEPGDLDLCVLTDSSASYLDQAMAMRKQLRGVGSPVALDVIPMIREPAGDHPLGKALATGRVIYERGN